MPVKSLFDYLEAGDTLDEFLDQFPTVNREVAVNVLEASRLALTAPNNRVETALRFVPGLLNVLASLKVGQLVKLTLD